MRCLCIHAATEVGFFLYCMQSQGYLAGKSLLDHAMQIGALARHKKYTHNKLAGRVAWLRRLVLSAAQDARATAADRRVDPAALTGRHKGRSSKEERLAKVHEGREGRDFGAAAARKKQKTGGTSNKQKARGCPPDSPA